MTKLCVGKSGGVYYNKRYKYGKNRGKTYRRYVRVQTKTGFGWGGVPDRRFAQIIFPGITPYGYYRS